MAVKFWERGWLLLFFFFKKEDRLLKVRKQTESCQQFTSFHITVISKESCGIHKLLIGIFLCYGFQSLLTWFDIKSKLILPCEFIKILKLTYVFYEHIWKKTDKYAGIHVFWKATILKSNLLWVCNNKYSFKWRLSGYGTYFQHLIG